MFNTMTVTKTAAALIGSLLFLLLVSWFASSLYHVGFSGHVAEGEEIPQAYRIPVEGGEGNVPSPPNQAGQPTTGIVTVAVDDVGPSVEPGAIVGEGVRLVGADGISDATGAGDAAAGDAATMVAGGAVGCDVAADPPQAASATTERTRRRSRAMEPLRPRDPARAPGDAARPACTSVVRIAVPPWFAELSPKVTGTSVSLDRPRGWPGDLLVELGRIEEGHGVASAAHDEHAPVREQRRGLARSLRRHRPGR